jgi:zinc protease
MINRNLFATDWPSSIKIARFAGRVSQPAFHANPQSLPGPDSVIRLVLDNGLTILVRENHTSPVVVLEGALPTGSIHDPIEKAGLSSFVAGMLTRGSKRYDFQRFNEQIESVGATLVVSSDLEQMNIGLTSLSEDFSQLVEVLSDVLQYPTFPEEQVDLLRRRRLVHLQEREQDTASVAHLRFYETIYGKTHPYGRPASGYSETVRSLQRSDLFDFHANRCTPNGAVFVIAGDVETQAVIDLLQRQFGSWQGPASQRQVEPAPPMPTPQIVQAVIPDKVQSDLVIGCRAVARHHPDFFAVRVANTILGVFGMMGRLGEVVREQQGLAYYSYSLQDSAQHDGVWLAMAGVNPENVSQAAASILGEFAKLGEEAVPAQELADSQAYLTGSLPLTLETNSGVASTLLDIEWLSLGLDYLHRYHDLIYTVTASDVQRVAKTYLSENAYALVVAGPADDNELS